MCEEWLLLAELEPGRDGYETSAAKTLMRRVDEAMTRCGEADVVARARLVMGEGHTSLRLETCSRHVLRVFQSLSDPDV